VTDSVGLWVRVLGQLEVYADGRVVPLRGVKQRRLMAALLAAANQVVSADRLADLIWAGAPPDGAAVALAKDVYRLRDVLGSVDAAGILITQSPGYRLNLDEDRIDAGVFAALVAQGQQLLPVDPARAVSVLDDALALWRGQAWAEFTDEDFARPLIAGLDELRALAVECRAEAMLTLGRHEEVVAELKPAVEAQPLRERRRSLLMRALYLSGRQVESLQVYREFRSVLMDELGLEPSPALRELEHDILAQRADLAVRVSRPIPSAQGRAVGLPGVAERFIGRVTELAWLEVLLARAAPGQRPVLAWLAGEAGVGKTSLAARFGRLACAHGSAVVFTRCEPVDGVAVHLLEVLGGPARTASSPTIEPETPRLQTVVDALARFGDGRPVLLVLDDVDRSRDDAIGFLQGLASVPCRSALCAVAVVRELPSDGVAEVPGPQAHARRLGGLTRDEVGELLESVSGATRPDELVESVWAETGGIPSLAAAVGRRLHQLDVNARAEAALTRAEGARRGLESVQDDIAAGVLARVEFVPSAAPAPSGQDMAPSSDAMCPYKGLASFGRSDSSLFCGRERLVATLVTKLAVNRFLAVIGPSGSGKSSLAAAGLMPALAAGALPGSDRWRCVLFRPGSDPMTNLVAAFARLTGQSPSALRQQLDRDGGLREGLAAGVLDEAQPGGGRLVLIVDQFEELFTACRDPETRAEFTRLLTSGVDDDSAVSVVVIMRADYYGACAEHPDLAAVMGRSQVLVTAMTDADLRRVVTEPARRAGLTVESGLAETICQDAAAQAGALPLVSTALLETWAARSGATLTLAGYLMAGGVRGAVARLAESV